MSPHPDESGPEPDDRLFVRPYVTVPEGHGPAYPAWPTLPEPVEAPTEPLPPVPAGSSPAVPAEPPRSVPAGPLPPGPPARPVAPTTRRREPGRRRGRLPLAVLTLTALAGTGALVFLTGGPEPQAPPPARPDVALPVLPAGSPGAGEPSVRSQAAPAKPSATTKAPTASPTSAKPSPSPSADVPDKPAEQPPADSGTLRPGDKGPEVRALQERLYGQGFTYVRVTGTYDGQTKRGVSQLQRDRDIKGDPNGVYGPATRAAFG
ncbi:peptidoglycan-binding protein [Streptomyces sp. NPDC059708]|uniref:peptidoglycan-binding domain-containing protein n=1 Tax=Streptomyces sp. NPDC059708 TaxID=3346916 RepID=UPI003688C5F0